MEAAPSKVSFLKMLGAALTLLGLILTTYLIFFKAPEKDPEIKIFTVALSESRSDVISKLYQEGFIKNEIGFRLALGFGSVSPGGYKIPKNLNAFSLAQELKEEPYLKWVVIREGLRKEEVAAILKDRLGWTDLEEERFLNKTNEDLNYEEGTLFPDTYLISKDETPEEVVIRMRNRFEEIFSAYATEAQRQNIRWPTVLKVASLIQREAAGSSDMALISGILWNRLEASMKLDIDATLQYIKGNSVDGWWGQVVPADKKIDSPFNTYLYKGLPPTPIANPGVSAIKAVLYPEETECIYYLHDAEKNIHCAKDYSEHKNNIELYLK